MSKFLGAVSCYSLYLFLAKNQKKDAAFIRARAFLLKNTAFTAFRKIPESKGVSFGQPFKLDDFLSVFSEESYIFENN